jgi:hypothetical protein
MRIPLRNSNDKRLGMAMKAFIQSAKFQTMLRLATLPTKTAAIYRTL